MNIFSSRTCQNCLTTLCFFYILPEKSLFLDLSIPRFPCLFSSWGIPRHQIPRNEFLELRNARPNLTQDISSLNQRSEILAKCPHKGRFIWKNSMKIPPLLKNNPPPSFLHWKNGGYHGIVLYKMIMIIIITYIPFITPIFPPNPPAKTKNKQII